MLGIPSNKIDEMFSRTSPVKHLEIATRRICNLGPRLNWFLHGRALHNPEQEIRTLKKEIALALVSILMLCKIYGITEEELLSETEKIYHLT